MLKQATDAARMAAGNHPDADVDQVSGLPSPQKAESEITARVGADSAYYAAVFVVDRVESVNLRHGCAAGDRLLQAFGRNLATKLTSEDQVFRWRGPAFVALLKRNDPADGVRAEVAGFVSTVWNKRWKSMESR